MKKQYYYVLSTHARQIKWYATYCRTHLGIRFKYVCTKFRKKEAEKDVLWCRWTFKLRSFYNRNSTGSFWGILRTWHFLRKWIMYSFAKADVNLKIYIEKIFLVPVVPCEHRNKLYPAHRRGRGTKGGMGFKNHLHFGNGWLCRGPGQCLEVP